jgi:hypothetical protein
MILTRRGWNRGNHAQHIRQRKAVGELRVAFSCVCVQCTCGGLEMVSVKGLPICRKCGRPHQTPVGTYWPIGHSSFCTAQEE